MFSTALCAIDGSESSLAAVRDAGELVGAQGRLTLLLATAYRHEGQARSPAIDPSEGSRIIARAREAAAEDAVASDVVVEPGRAPAELVLERSAGFDLLAIGSPLHSSWLGALFMGAVAASVERRLPVPLLAAPAEHSRPLLAEPRRLLVASDGLEDSDELVAFARRLADEHGFAATLLHVLGGEPRSHPHRVERQGLELAPQEGPRVEVGNPRELVVEVARELDASIVLAGSRRTHGIAAVGSVSRRIAAHAPCPVLLIPPELLHADAGTLAAGC